MPITERLYNVKRILELYEQLDRESLSAQELEELVQLSNELYEKALILRFKAAEERIFGPNGEKNTKEVPSVEVAESSIDEIDFSIFEKIEESEEEPIELAEENQDRVHEAEVSLFELRIEEVTLVEEIVVVAEEEQTVSVDATIIEEMESSNQWISFFEKVLKDHASGLQTPLTALAGSFGLNERILYINELFDGEAEAFSNLIQKMDKIGDWRSCSAALSAVAEESNWEMDNDVTGEFVLHVKRKYV